jgi:hypothetical protein
MPEQVDGYFPEIVCVDYFRFGSGKQNITGEIDGHHRIGLGPQLKTQYISIAFIQLQMHRPASSLRTRVALGNLENYAAIE